MAVKQEAKIARFIGASTDTKPTSAPVGSTFYEYDTKLLYITPDDGTTWSVKTGGTSGGGDFISIFTSSAATTTTITAAALADVVSQYIGQVVLPLQGAMAGEARYITAYNGTNQLTVSPAWASDPDAAGNISFAVMSGALGIMPVALGTNGTTVTDSATTVLGAIGANNNNNAFSSASVVADADGSVLERLEYTQSIIGAPQTLNAANDTVAQGFYAATTLSAVDADLAVGNIKTNVTIFGFKGTYDTEAGQPITAGAMKTGDVGFVNGAKITGTGTKTLSAANDTVNAGYYEATTLSAIDADLAVGNIATGKTVFGFAGDYDTSATPIAAGRMKTGDEGWANGSKITGTGTKTLIVANDTVNEGYYAATTLSAVDADLAVGNIKTGVDIFGFTGTYDTSATPITAGTVQTGLEGWVNGAKVTGSGTKTLSDVNDTVSAGYYAATTLSAVDTDLAAANIAVGKTIFGFIGSYTSDGDAIASEIAKGKYAYVNGVKLTGTYE